MRYLVLSLLPVVAFCEPASVAPSSKVNYPSNFQVESGCNLFVLGDGLYWTAQEAGLYYAQETGGGLKQLDPNYSGGLRVGIGLTFPKEGFDTLFSWVYFSSQAEKHSHGSLLPLWAEPDFSPLATASKASGKWDLDLNVADLEWGRSSWFGGHFSCRPFFSLRGAWIEQHFHAHYTYVTTPVTTGHLRANSSFQGGGLRAGADSRFALPYGFSVYGTASGSLLYGTIDGDASTLENSTVIAKTKDHFNTGISAVQLALGWGWDTHFAKERLHLELHMGWEANLWFSINQMNHFVNGLSQGLFFKEKGNLSTQGLTAGGRFSF